MTDSAPVLHRSVSNLRLVGIAEGISFLLLLGVGMPLKYIAGLPLAVRIMGSLHGFLFVLFLIALSHASSKRDWAPQTSVSYLIASVLPFGFLMVDGRLKREMTAP